MTSPALIVVKEHEQCCPATQNTRNGDVSKYVSIGFRTPASATGPRVGERAVGSNYLPSPEVERGLGERDKRPKPEDFGNGSANLRQLPLICARLGHSYCLRHSFLTRANSKGLIQMRRLLELFAAVPLRFHFI